MPAVGQRMDLYLQYVLLALPNGEGKGGHASKVGNKNQEEIERMHSSMDICQWLQVRVEEVCHMLVKVLMQQQSSLVAPKRDLQHNDSCSCLCRQGSSASAVSWAHVRRGNNCPGADVAAGQ